MNIGSFLNSIISTQTPVPKVYSKTILSNNTKNKLLSFQEKPVLWLINILQKYHIALAADECGTGKTYMAIAICKELNRRPFINCPKTLIPAWREVLDYFGVKEYDIVNYETIRAGKTYKKNNKYNIRKKSHYIEILDHDPDDPSKYTYGWNVPNDAIIIFDEAHRCENPSTDNGKLLLSTKQLILNKIPVLMLSATICEKFTDMKIPFCLFGLIPNSRNFGHYINTLWHKYPQYRVKKSNYATIADYKLAKNNSQAMIIHEEIKEYMSRITVKELGDKFPANQICALQFFAEESQKISEAYDKIAKIMKKLKNNPGVNDLARIQKLKQEIELRKIPIFIEQANSYLGQGKSVIIFVNYLDTMEVLANELNIKCKIHGKQTMEERKTAIDLFQSNKEKIIILQCRAGGVGIGLHDLSGYHPRITLINYPDSGKDLLQVLGRAARSEAKTPVLQRIIFVANVDYEKNIMQNINRKLANLSVTNDGNTDSYKYGLKKLNDNDLEEDVIDI